MTHQVIYAWTEGEAADISGDAHPILCMDLQCTDRGLPWLVDDGAIYLDDDYTYAIDVVDICVTVILCVLAGSLGYLIGWTS